MRSRSPIRASIQTLAGCLLITLTLWLLGGLFAVVSAAMLWIQLLPAIAIILHGMAVWCVLIGGFVPAIAAWQIAASTYGWWRIECALDTSNDRWAWRGWHASGTHGWERWGFGVDVLGCRLDVYTVQGDKA